MSLVHPTTQEYFNERKLDLFPSAHEQISSSCITYLLMKPFRDEGALHGLKPFGDRCAAHPLLGYAAVNWGTHARIAASGRATEFSLSLLEKKRAMEAAFQALILNTLGSLEIGTEWPEDWFEEEQGLMNDELKGSITQVSPLHVAAYFGLSEPASVLLEKGHAVDERDSVGTTPLHWAIINRQHLMLEFLLEKGADPNVEKDRIWLRRFDIIGNITVPLGIAAHIGDTIAINALIKHGADVNKSQAVIEDQKTPLSIALYGRHHDAAKLLLRNGADINVDPSGVAEAATDCTLETFQMLLENDISMGFVQNALKSAAYEGQLDRLKLLLRSGADANGPPISTEGERVLELVEGHADDGKIVDEEEWQITTPLVACIANRGSRLPGYVASRSEFLLITCLFMSH